MITSQFARFLNNISTKPLSVLDASIDLQMYVPLDLSTDNQILKEVNVSSSDVLGHFINHHIDAHHGKVGYGGYNETRNIYRRSSYFHDTDPNTERNIHLGIDLWLNSGSPIYAPLDGIVHSFANNKNHGDYGPTIILEHHVEDHVFYTLYGHLSLDSIADLAIGKPFEQGEQMATLGDASLNGDYPPHLHFQIIRDLQQFKGDYPGVCNLVDRSYYMDNCPDPNVLLKLKSNP